MKSLCIWTSIPETLNNIQIWKKELFKINRQLTLTNCVTSKCFLQTMVWFSSEERFQEKWLSKSDTKWLRYPSFSLCKRSIKLKMIVNTSINFKMVMKDGFWKASGAVFSTINYLYRILTQCFEADLLSLRMKSHPHCQTRMNSLNDTRVNRINLSLFVSLQIQNESKFKF